MLPDPNNYGSWQEFARALILGLPDTDGIGEGSGGGGVSGGQITGTVPAASMPSLPAGLTPVFWNSAEEKLFLQSGNLYLPPPVITPFQIDTQSLALASVELQTIADGAVSTSKVQDLAILNAKIGNATILSAKVGDAQIVNAKIADLAVNTAKVLDASILTAKIGDAQISSAKIGAASIYAAAIIDLAVANAKITDATILTAKIANAQITNALIADATILSAKIGLAQIVSALIQDAAIGSAKIADLAVLGAKIADAAIVNAKIADAAITSAKIAELTVSKLVGGTLNAIIQVAGGRFEFTVGGSTLFIGNGFGSSNQFFLWFGPAVGITDCTEANAVVYLKTNGQAYFGGSLAVGVIRNAARSTDQSATAMTLVGPFTSNGGPVTIITSYGYTYQGRADAGTGTITGSGGAQIITERSIDNVNWTNVSTVNANETQRSVVVDGDPAVKDIIRYSLGASVTSVVTLGAGNNFFLRSRVASRTLPAFGGTGISNVVQSQEIGLSGTE